VVTDIVNVFTVYFQKGNVNKMNNRKCYGLSFCNSGQITYSRNDKNYIFSPGHAIILPQGQSYSLHADESGVFPVINFECADFLCDTIIVLPVKNIDSVMNDFNQMKKLFLFEKNRAKILSLFYNIIHNLSGFSTTENNLLFPAIKYIENNYSSGEITNTLLAQECNISEVYLRKLFSTQYGTSPRQYIIDTRINNAKQLLTEGILKISAISEKCGFTSPYHFSRIFKEKTGVTPTQYLKEHRKSKI
jgi:AraC-like DNA-binding protein